MEVFVKKNLHFFYLLEFWKIAFIRHPESRSTSGQAYFRIYNFNKYKIPTPLRWAE